MTLIGNGTDTLEEKDIVITLKQHGALTANPHKDGALLCPLWDFHAARNPLICKGLRAFLL